MLADHLIHKNVISVLFDCEYAWCLYECDIMYVCLCGQNHWVFKLRVTIARACVSSSRSIKLVNDIELLQGEEQAEGGSHTAPLLVVGQGHAFAVPQLPHKKAIMGVVHKVQTRAAYNPP